MDRFERTTTSPAETEALGASLARMLPSGAMLALHGELASGKTCFVRGVASVLAGDAEVSSPTFTLINEYKGALPVYHLDLYRLSSADELADLGVEDVFDGAGVCLVEWAERAEGTLPARRVEIRFAHAGGDRRSIAIVNMGILPPGWQDNMAAPIN